MAGGGARLVSTRSLWATLEKRLPSTLCVTEIELLEVNWGEAEEVHPLGFH